MSDWAQTRRVRGRILLSGAETVTGDLHLQPLGAPEHPVESPLEMLNRSEPFFALSVEDDVRLVAKSAVRGVALDAGDAETHPYAHHAQVEIHMDDGSDYRGTIDIELPAPNLRPLDFFNQSEPFFGLRADDCSWCLARRHVVWARPLD